MRCKSHIKLVIQGNPQRGQSPADGFELLSSSRRLKKKEKRSENLLCLVCRLHCSVQTYGFLSVFSSETSLARGGEAWGRAGESLLLP